MPSRLNVFWFSKDNSSGHSERKNRRRGGKTISRSGQEWILPAQLGQLKTGQDNYDTKKAATRLGILGLIQFVLGLCLLITGGFAISVHGDTEKAVGKPYHTSAFIVGVFIMLQSGFGLVIFSLEWYGNHDTLMNNIYCLLHAYAVFALINVVVCFVGPIITGVFGICSSRACFYEEYTAKNSSMATAILIFILISFVSSIGNFVMLHIYQSDFGLSVLPTGQNSCIDDVETNQNREATTYQE